MLAALAVGILNWIFVDPLGLHPMVATLATFMGLKAIALILRPMPGGLISETIIDRISTTVGFIPLAVIVATVAAVTLEFVLHKTNFGISLRGVGSRREAARMAGIRPRRMLFIAYVSCSLLAAAAAIPLMAQVGTGDANTGEKLYPGEHCRSGHRRREPVRRARLLCRLLCSALASDADQHRDHVPRSR